MFLKNKWRLYGLLDTIISNHGIQFARSFWQHLYIRLGMKLRLSIVFHPKTNGERD
jgi:hypothetical protein